MKLYSLKKTMTVKKSYKNYDIPLKSIIKYYWSFTVWEKGEESLFKEIMAERPSHVLST